MKAFLKVLTIFMASCVVFGFNDENQVLAKVSGAATNQTIADEKKVTSAFSSSESLIKCFDTPPSEARPWVYWWWMDHVSRESITRDLEALKDKGIGGVLIYHCAHGLPKNVFGKPKKMWTPEWMEMVRYADEEAKRLGLGFNINYTAGSTGAGGPWIDVAHSGQIIVWSGVQLKGGTHIERQLPHPEVREDFYQDVSVMAYPIHCMGDYMRLACPVMKVSSQEFIDAFEAECMLDGDSKSYWSSSAGRAGGEFVDFEFSEPFTSEAVLIMPRQGWTPAKVEVLSSEDGKVYQSVKKVDMPPDKPLTIPIPATTSRHYRIAFPQSQSRDGRIGIAELRLLAPGEKAYPDQIAPFAYFSEQIANNRHRPSGVSSMWSGGDMADNSIIPDVDPAKIVDLTSRMDANGVLCWDAPAGNWEIIRFGRTSLGHRARIGGSQPVAYHVDYLDPESMNIHFTEGIDPLLKAIGYGKDSALMALHEDSFEMPFNRWTASFAEEFKKRRGYDLFPWLPVLAGRVVESKGASERFLWDYRRTIADLYITHWEKTRKLCHDRNLLFESEAAGPQPYCFDGLAQLGRTDIPMGEFWSGIYQPGIPVDEQHRGCWGTGSESGLCETIRQTASAAHLYGKPIVAAESFTGYSRPFVLDPFDVKAFGDRALCDGLNRFVIHLYMTQPLEEYKGKPVVVRLHAFDYNRRTTWFEQSRFWTDYLARCSAMLQAGQPVADVCCFLGEGAPALVSQREFMEPQIPPGYDYDACNAELLLNATVNNGRISFPSGASYALLTLPPEMKAMTPEIMRHLRKLVKDGATLLGPKPQYSPSFFDCKNADAQVEKLANQIWGSSTENSGEHAFGKGRVIWGKTVAQALKAVDCEPACLIEGADSVLFVQRHTDEGEIFFISQQDKKPVDITVSLRAANTNVVPELWDPATGQREAIAVFCQYKGRIEIPTHLDERGSVFVVLRPGKPDNHLVSVSHETNENDFRVIRDKGKLKLVSNVSGKFKLAHDNGNIQTLTVPSVPQALNLSTDWNLTFEGIGQTIKMQKLISWTELSQADMRNYSGTVTYRKSFSCSAPSERMELDLGSLKNIAEVILNGKPIGLLWKPPYRLDITSAMMPGDNELEIKVTNLLVNRITADYSLPEEQRHFYSFGAVEQYQPGVESGKDGLLPSGLLGPITIRKQVEVTIEGVPSEEISTANDEK